LLGLALSLGLVAVAKADEKKPTEIKGWGTVLDPDGDCSIAADKGKLTLKVPGSLHDLHGGKVNAPRVWQEVEGDFVAQVKVTSDWKPGASLPTASTAPYNGAGLLVWDSEKHHVRWERNLWLREGQKSWSYLGPIHTKDDRAVLPKDSQEEFFKGRSTWLRLERAGGKLTASISHDGKEWTETGVVMAEFPKPVRVGVAAINSSAGEFMVEFEEFELSKK
jgi:regulation of enolase protein 1 (concanavalin A-like superfamily)